MSFLRKLFGLGGPAGEPDPSAGLETVSHEGYLIRPAPIPEGGQFRLCAIVTKEIDGQTREHRLVRADILPSREDAAAASIRKAKLMIAEQGERIFS